MKRKFVQAVAYHEAGHAIAALEHGIRIRRTSIVSADGYSGILQHENPLRGVNLDCDQTDRGIRKVEKLIVLCLTGLLRNDDFHLGPGDAGMVQAISTKQTNGRVDYCKPGLRRWSNPRSASF